jgi:hypothetical protein
MHVHDIVVKGRQYTYSAYSNTVRHAGRRLKMESETDSQPYVTNLDISTTGTNLTAQLQLPNFRLVGRGTLHYSYACYI